MWARKGDERGAQAMMVAEVLMVAATTLRPTDRQRFMLRPTDAAAGAASAGDAANCDAGAAAAATTGSHIASKA